jgi:hypothetical protein
VQILKINFVASSEIEFSKPPDDSLLVEYNEMLAAILAENSGRFKYLASPTINRMEAQTHFFERLEKFVQLHKMLSDNESLGIWLSGDDLFFFKELREAFGNRIVKSPERGGIPGGPRQVAGPLRLVKRAAVSFAETLSLILASRKGKGPKTRYTNIFRTYFDHRSRTEAGGLREEYFGPFLSDLASESDVLVVFRMLHKDDCGELLSLQKGPNPFDSAIFERFLGVFTLCKAYLLYLFSRISLKKRYFYKNLDITGLLQRSLNEDYYFLKGISVYTEREAAVKILKLQPGRLYFPYENQTWEKVYPLVRRRLGLKDVSIIGFQHTGVSYKLLNYFPARNEMALPFFPDKVVTVGAVFKRLFEEKAHYPCPIVEGAALRHMKFVKNGKLDTKPPHSSVQGGVAYAFSYDTTKYGSIISALIKEFSGSRVKVYLKIHPDYDEQEVMRSVKLELPANFILSQKIPWSRVYDSVDCILYDDNSIGVEGLINGVKTYLLDVGEPVYNCDRMYYFSEWRTTIGTARLGEIRREIENGSFDTRFDRDKVEKYLYLYYNVYSKDKYFSAYL